ncbi:hypothetical protein [Micromonospora craniellae]|uniref:Uncharacterized protein n=1 Tax=Micromonospora craniellae TaxID=2294034 RepID=A0A372FZH5_9ACTN|nr:hypothetical protein [Micromonospora craniellae]QOC91469.1 hypothetical protein ID554_26455 [Micromonospora craniellae]RFS46207.1 hypothetical protein D0Q02_12140 [Micromonospora craniellae]
MTGPLYLPTEATRHVPTDLFGRPADERPERARGGRGEPGGHDPASRHAGPTVAAAVPGDE